MRKKVVYYFGDKVDIKKERSVFKSVSSSGRDIENIIRVAQEYVNAFLNTEGILLYIVVIFNRWGDIFWYRKGWRD
jgi:hypothetical protein